MFLGEFICLIIFTIKSLCSKNGGFSQQNINPLYMAIPASCDLCGSSLVLVALTMSALSVYQMIRGSMVVITAIIALIFLGRKQYAHHWLSLSFIVTGVAIVGVVSILSSKDGGDTSTTSLLGILILMISICISGGQMVIEEKILGGRTLDPLFVVGFEGFWGLCLMSFLLPLF